MVNNSKLFRTFVHNLVKEYHSPIDKQANEAYASNAELSSVAYDDTHTLHSVKTHKQFAHALRHGERTQDCVLFSLFSDQTSSSITLSRNVSRVPKDVKSFDLTRLTAEDDDDDYPIVYLIIDLIDIIIGAEGESCEIVISDMDTLIEGVGISSDLCFEAMVSLVEQILNLYSEESTHDIALSTRALEKSCFGMRSFPAFDNKLKFTRINIASSSSFHGGFVLILHNYIDDESKDVTLSVIEENLGRDFAAVK